MLWSTLTLLCVMAIYPLSLLDTASMSIANDRFSGCLRVLASTQLITAAFGAVLSFVFTQFAWYAALTGLYQVDTYSGLLIKEHPRKKQQRAANMTLKE